MNNSSMKQDYFPTGGWRISLPEAQHIEEAVLLRVDEGIRADYPDVHSFLVIRHGYLVFERYYCGYNHEREHEVRSITKSFISALVGIALKEGYLTSLDQKVIDLLPNYFDSDADPRKKAITLRHLLTMTAGFDCDNDENFWLMRQHRDWAKATLDTPMRCEPGEQFNYDSAAMHLLSVILTHQTGMSAFDYAQARLFKPLGMQVHHWPHDPLGNSEGAAGLRLTARDMAKFGYLYLNSGQWEGQEIVPTWFVRDSTRKQSEGGDPEPANYGYLWWVLYESHAVGYCAAGYGGQYIFVFPNQDLIIVTTADHTLMPPPEAPMPLFLKHILPAAR